MGFFNWFKRKKEPPYKPTGRIGWFTAKCNGVGLFNRGMTYNAEVLVEEVGQIAGRSEVKVLQVCNATERDLVDHIRATLQLVPSECIRWETEHESQARIRQQ